MPSGPTITAASATGLVGRDAEVHAIVDVVAGGVRWLTLTGPPGVGKTRLALAAAAALDERFPGGVHVLALAPLTDPSQVGPAVAAALGLQSGDDAALVAALEWTPGRPETLLVLDNLEHLTGAAPLLASLLRASPTLWVLATSRVRLTIDGEHERLVPPLALPPRDDALGPDDLLAVPAVRLFVDSARQFFPAFALADGNAADVAELCRRLDGLPLAIELAAARTKALSPRQILGQLAGDLTILSGGPTDAPARSRSMQATIDWSYDRLPPDQRRALRSLGVFAGGFTVDAAAQVAGADLDILGALMDTSLVTRQPPAAPDGDDLPRFALLETIRTFALDRLEREGELDATRRRHIAWLLSVTEPIDYAIYGRRQVAITELYEHELGNIRAAMGWAVAAAEADLAQRLAASLRGFCHIRSIHMSEGIGWLHAALDLDGASPDVRARCLAELALLCLPAPDPTIAGTLLAEADALIVETDHLETRLRVTLVHAHRCLFTRDHVRGTALVEECFALAAPLSDRFPAMCMIWMGHAGNLQFSGDLDRAEETYRYLLDSERSDSGPYAANVARGQIADIAREKGDLPGALTALSDALLVFLDDGALWAVGRCMGMIGIIVGQQRQWVAASKCFGSASTIHRRTGVATFALDEEAIAATTAAGIAAIGQAAWDAAWQDGFALEPEVAAARVVAIARDEPIAAEQATHRPHAATLHTSQLHVPEQDGALGDTFVIPLTPRQRAVLRGLMRGFTNAEIGAELSISPRTVEDHVAQLTAKLGVRTRREAAVFAARHRVLEPGSPERPAAGPR